MKATVLGITTTIFIFLLLVILLQNRVTPRPPPPLQATFEAVSAEATRVAERAAQMAAERHVMATSEAMQSKTDQIHTRIAEESGRPLATPVEALGAPAAP